MISPYLVPMAKLKREIRARHPSCKYQTLTKLDSRGVQRCLSILGLFCQVLFITVVDLSQPCSFPEMLLAGIGTKYSKGDPEDREIQ